MSADSITEANRKAFDAFAASYNEHPWQPRLAKQILESLQERKDWLGAGWKDSDKGHTVRLLDYACGTGAATLALHPFVTEARGMDLSEGMVKKYNETMSKAKLSHEHAHAVVRDLLADASDPPTGDNLFDVAIISLALHHVSDPPLLIQRLAQQLKPGSGVLIVLDFLPFSHDHSMHKGGLASMAHTITKHGFDEDEMSELYSQAGLHSFGWQVLAEPAIFDESDNYTERKMFVARGTRSA